MSDYEVHLLRKGFAGIREDIAWVKTILLTVLKGQDAMSVTEAQILNSFQALSSSLDNLGTEVTDWKTAQDEELQNILQVAQQAQSNPNDATAQAVVDAISAANLKLAKLHTDVASAMDEANQVNATAKVVIAPISAATPPASSTTDPSDSANTSANSTATNGSSTPGSLNNTISNPGSLTAPDTSQPSTLAESTAADTPGFVPTSSTGTTGAVASATSNVTSDNGDPIPDASKSDTGTTNTVTG